jgi:hypothetical protein
MRDHVEPRPYRTRDPTCSGSFVQGVSNYPPEPICFVTRRDSYSFSRSQQSAERPFMGRAFLSFSFPGPDLRSGALLLPRSIGPELRELRLETAFH